MQVVAHTAVPTEKASVHTPYVISMLHVLLDLSAAVMHSSSHSFITSSVTCRYPSSLSLLHASTLPLPYPLTQVAFIFPCHMQVISEDLGLKLESTDISMMGRAKKITITKDDTIILDGGGDKASIGERCDQIREAVAQSTSDYDRWVAVSYLHYASCPAPALLALFSDMFSKHAVYQPAHHVLSARGCVQTGAVCQFQTGYILAHMLSVAAR